MKIIILGLLLTMVGCGEISTNIREDVGNSVVKILGERSGGTGFSVMTNLGNRYILTNKHICDLRDNNNMLNVIFPNMLRTYKRKVIEIDTSHDLCLVESIPAFTNSVFVASESTIGQTTHVVGHPRLFALTVSSGQFIEEVNISVRMSSIKGEGGYIVLEDFKIPFRLNLSNVRTFPSARFIMYARGGNSGSPIVNDNGEVVSVLYAGSTSDPMISYGVPLRFIRMFLEGY